MSALGAGKHLMVEAGVIECLHCKWWCRTGCPCRCCLAAEVERLTAALAERDSCIAAVEYMAERAAGHGYDLDAHEVLEYLRGTS